MDEICVDGEVFTIVSVALRRDGAESLSHAERAVAALVVQGLSNRAIAVRRATAARTVANQIASIYRKLGVGSRRELAASLSLHAFDEAS